MIESNLMMHQLITIAPETFNPDHHELPTAGELLMAGDRVIVNDGVAMNAIGNQTPIGWVIEVSKKGDVVEIAALGEQQEDGGFYFEEICVLEIS
ncbi:MAG: hypothetical protein AAFV93_04520 [Chloroflexota bacterium]